MIRTHKELAAIHKSCAEAHEQHAQYHQAAADDRATAIENCEKVMAKVGKAEQAAVTDPVNAFLKAEIARHGEMKEHHTTAAEFHMAKAEEHRARCEECEKAATGSLEKSGDGEIEWLDKHIDSRVERAIGNTVVPPLISRVAPTAPGNRLVPRVGQELSHAQQGVPLEFKKLVMVDEDA